MDTTLDAARDAATNALSRALHLPILGLVLAGLFLTGAGSARGEDVFFETVDVELVNVEVWARDASGQPVSGLTAEDFQVSHDGDPVTISHFSEFRGGRPVRALPSSEEAGAWAEAEPSHLVIYFDQLRLHPNSYGPLTRDLEEFLASGAVDPERVLILRQDRNLFVAANFGSSLGQLRKALQDLGSATSRSAGLGSDSELALDELRRAWDEAQTTISSRSGGLQSVPTTFGIPGDSGSSSSPRTAVGGAGTSFFGRDNEACGLFLDRIEPIIDGWAFERSQRLGVSLENLTQAGTFLAALPGVKTFLYLSDSLEMQPAAALASYVGKLCPTGQTSALLSSGTNEIARATTRLTRHLNSNQVTVHSLQAGGLQAPSSVSARRGGGASGGDGGATQRADRAFETAQRVSERDGLALIARETGGRAVFDQNSLGDDLTEIGRDMATYYSLAYQPPPGESGVEHRIEVRVPGRKIATRYRRGYLSKDAGRWMTERLEGALNLGLVSNPLGVGLGAGDLRPAQSGNQIFPLHVFLPIAELAFLDQGEGEVAEISVEVLARHLGSETLATTQRRLRVRKPESQERTGFAVDLELVPGDHTIAVGVRDDLGRRSSFVSTTVHVAGP